MPQIRKPEIHERLAQAALVVFARDGYEGATVAAIASEAGVSTGNVYRYHASKEALFRAVVPDSLVHRFRALLAARLQTARGVRDLATKPPESYLLASAELLGFTVEHRLAVLILLGRSEGSTHAKVRGEIEAELIRAAVTHAREMRKLSEPVRFAIGRIYAGFLDTLVEALATFDDPARLRAAVEAFTAYHLAGLRTLLLA
ncbi:MAG: TetR/AcrR family transcriptional regulator [Polyangiales bacterium]